MLKKQNFFCLAILIGIASLLSCVSAKPTAPQSVGVSVHSVNYSSREVSLIVIDPLDKSNGSGGDALNPYGMGGAICCFSIPSVWHPGYQVIVKYNFYPDEKWHEQLVDVPPYKSDHLGNLWLAMHEDGSAEAVVSQTGPAGADWPGRVKGQPVPSEQYAKRIIDNRIKTQKDILVGLENGLKSGTDDLTVDQVERLKRAIENTKKRIKIMEESKP